MAVELISDSLPLVLAATETDEGLNPLVRVVPGLMVWTLLAFGVALLVLRKFAWPKISEILDQRQKQIEDSIDHAEQTRKEADELLAEYRRRLTEAREQADEIVARANKAADSVRAEAASEGKARREELVDAARKDIETETRRSLEAIRREVADLTVLATEQVTRKSLNADDQKRLIEEALAEVDFSALAGEESGAR